MVARRAALVVLRPVDAVSAFRRFDGRQRVGRMAPGGPFLVGLVGVALVAAGGYAVYRAG